jgi:hypothetical protein
MAQGGVAMPFDDAIRSMLREEIRAAMREELRALLPELRGSRVLDDFLSAREAAQVARVSPATIRAWLRRAELKRYGTVRLPRIRREDLIRFMASQVQRETEQPRTIEEQAASIFARQDRAPAQPPRRAAPARAPSRPDEERPAEGDRQLSGPAVP